MKYRCLVFDHDDTTVNSTATIHHPCFERFLQDYFPERSCSLEEYFLKNFSPGFVPMCREEYGMDDETLALETEYWQEYVRDRIPEAYPGIREIMLQQKQNGGLIAVISHSYRHNILRDYAANGLPVLMIDDLKPGFDMALSCGVPFAAVGWANDIEPIETFMRSNCSLYFKRVSELAAYLQEQGG